MPVIDYSVYTGFRKGSGAEYQITALMEGGVEIPVAPAEPPLETAAIAQPPTVIAANAATFQSATGWTVPTGVTIDTTGNGRAVVDGSGASRNIDRTIPALDPDKTYGVTVGFANKVAGRNQVSFQGGTAITLMGNGYLTGHRTARFSPASAHTLMRISLFTETSNPQMDVIDAQIADITAMLLNPRAIFIDAGQSNAAGAFARTGFNPELDKPELRCLAVPSRTATTLNCVTDGTGATYGTALTSSNGIGTPQPMTTPLAHVTAVATDVTVTPAVMPALSASRHLCDNWPYPGYTPTMILSGAAQASLFNVAHWDFEASPAGGYYRLMRAQIDAQLSAMPGSFVAGFFWQQGEADSGNLEYNAKFARMIAELRAAYGDFPVVIREIGGLLSTGNTAAFIDRQKRLASNSGHADALARCAYIGRPVGIADNLLLEDEAGSWIHYRADTSRTMGTAGAQAMVDLLVRRPVPGAVPAPVNTVAPVLSGSTTPGSTLTTTAGTFTGGTGALTYQTRWQRSTDSGVTWAVIAGQTALTYVTTGEADGTQIRAQRQATDTAALTSGWASSNVITMAAAASVPVNTALPTTSGGTTVGATRTITSGTWTNSPTSYQSRWQRSTDGGTTWAIAQGADGTLRGYTHVAGDAGALIRCQVQASNGAGASVYASTTTYTVTAAAATAPANTAAPVISGGAAEGDSYVHAGDTWTGSTPMTPTYLWELSVANGAWTQFSTAASPLRPAGHGGNRVRLTKTMTNSVTGTSVMSNILNIAADAAPSNLRAGTVTDPGVGLYLNWNRYTEVHGSPFIDHLKLGDGWRSSGGGNLNWNQLLAAGHIDAEGRAISKPAGADNLLFPALAAMPAQSDGSRRYRLFYEGNITNGWVVGSAGDQATGTDHGLNYIDFDYTANGSNSASLLLDSWTGTVTLRGLVRHDDLADFHLGHTFRRPWLEMLRNTRMLRFVDWMGTENYEGSGLWANRYTPGRATYQGGEGVPVEVMCQLCNLIGADPWFSLVSNANDNYVTQFATVARNTLNPTRHMFLEPSSKVWDGANYATADHFRALAVSWFGDNSIEASMEAYGGRASQIFQLARAVWSGANLPRLHTVLQGWTPNAGISEFALTAPRFVALGGGRVAPWTITTDYALHANLDGDMRYDGTSTRDPLDSLIAANGNNSPTVFNYMANAMRTGGGYSMSGLTTAYAAQKTMIANYGNPNVICYEGGSHLCVPPERNNNANWIQTFINFHASQIWADVYQENVENWYDAFGPSNTYVFKSDIRMPDQNNGYGILRWSGDTVSNPRLTMFNSNVNTRVGDGTRGVSDFVGLFDTTDGYAS